MEHYINKYKIWSSYEPEEKGVFIACSSIYGNTLRVANKIAEIIKEKCNMKVVVVDLTREDWAEAIEDAFRYSHLIVAASSYNAGLFPPMQQFLERLQDRNYQKRKVGIIENGSWAPSAARCMKNMLEKMKEIEIVEPIVTIRSTMKENDVPKLQELAKKLVEDTN